MEKITKDHTRLIANFMGWVDSPYANLPNKVYTRDFEHGKMLMDFKFYSDWNELMEVVDRIENLGHDSRIIGNNSDGGFVCDFQIAGSNEEMSCDTSYTSKIDAVYNAVIKFIIENNNQHLNQ